MAYTYEDGDGEGEVRLKLPPGPDLAKKVVVDCQPTSLKVSLKGGGPALLDAGELFSKVKPHEVAWYVEGGEIVISLQKLASVKWPALTRQEALEKRFGPLTGPQPQRGGPPAAPLGELAREHPHPHEHAHAEGEGHGEGCKHPHQEKERQEQQQQRGTSEEGGPAETGEGDGAGDAGRDGAGDSEDTDGAEAEAEAGNEDEDGEGEGEDEGAGAYAARENVERLLRAARAGDVADFRAAAAACAEQGHSLEESVGAVRDGNRRGALHFAAHAGATEMCAHLVDEMRVGVEARDEAGETPLMLAAREGHVAAAEALLARGADVAAAVEGTGTAPIHLAALQGSAELIRKLVQKGASVNAPSDAGPPLLWACGNGHHEAVEALLELGADPNLANGDRVTPLLAAAVAQHARIVETLVKHGADANGCAGAGVAPIFIAAIEGDARMLEALLAGGADVDALDEEGSTPIMAAAAQGHRHVVERLLPLSKPHPSLKEWSVDAVLAASKSGVTESSFQAKAAAGSAAGAGGGARQQQQQPQKKPTEAGGASEAAPEGKRKKAADGAKARADASFRAQDWQGALDAYTQALDLDASNAALFSNRSLCWMRLGQPEHALADARAARAARPDWAKACYREGSALRMLQRYEDAANAFFDGVQMDSSNIELASAFKEAVDAGRKAHEAAKLREAGLSK